MGDFTYMMIQHLGVTWYTAYSIAKAIEMGMDIASIISIITGVGGWIGMFYSAIKKKIISLGMKAAISW